MTLTVKWLDRGREPQCPPDPNYPAGKDVDISDGAQEFCSSALPYPAKRCGMYFVECLNCGCNAVVTTAGRRDDPRRIKLACKRHER